jgi:hypothetical protein
MKAAPPMTDTPSVSSSGHWLQPTTCSPVLRLLWIERGSLLGLLAFSSS